MEAVLSKHLSRRKARERERFLQDLIDNNQPDNAERRPAIVRTLEHYEVPTWAQGVRVEKRMWGFQWRVVATDKRGH